MKENILQYKIYFWNSYAKESFSTEDAFVFTTGIQSPFFNLVLLKKPNLGTLESILPKAHDFFYRHQVSWGVNVIDNLSTQLLFPYLEDRNFKKINTEHELDTELSIFPSVSPCSSVKEVINVNMLRDWAIPVESGFGVSKQRIDHFYKLTEAAFNKEANKLKYFVLYENNEPISAATLAIHDKIARLDSVATVKHKQGQGYGGKIVEYCIAYAQKSGSMRMVFEGSKQGIYLYRKIGFTETGLSYIYSLSE